MSSTSTPLARTLTEGHSADHSADHSATRTTPLEVFRLARRRWLKGERINLSELAKEVGIGRATLFRWVGSKDQLMVEILWSLYEPIFRTAVAESGGTGVDHLVAVHRRVMEEILAAEPVQRFLRQDPDYALRILADTQGTLHARIVALTREHLESLEARGELSLPIPASRFATVLIRINTSLMYSDSAADRAQAIREACTIMRLLVDNRDPG